MTLIIGGDRETLSLGDVKSHSLSDCISCQRVGLSVLSYRTAKYAVNPIVKGEQTVVSVDHAEPADVVDLLLWRDAQHMLGRHSHANGVGACVWCGVEWPCPPRRLAERAEVAARRQWRDAWTARHDLNALRTLPSWRDDLRPPNRGVFPVDS